MKNKYATWSDEDLEAEYSELVNEHFRIQKEMDLIAAEVESRTSPDEDPYCTACNGTGEGQYDGSRCYSCKGSGVERRERD